MWLSGNDVREGLGLFYRYVGRAGGRATERRLVWVCILILM